MDKPKGDRPEPPKPCPSLKAADYNAYMRIYMRWWRWKRGATPRTILPAPAKPPAALHRVDHKAYHRQYVRFQYWNGPARDGAEDWWK